MKNSNICSAVDTNLLSTQEWSSHNLFSVNVMFPTFVVIFYFITSLFLNCYFPCKLIDFRISVLFIFIIPLDSKHTQYSPPQQSYEVH